MIAITTSNSISVNAISRGVDRGALPCAPDPELTALPSCILHILGGTLGYRGEPVKEM